MTLVINKDVEHCFGSSMGLGSFLGCAECDVQTECNDKFSGKGRSSRGETKKESKDISSLRGTEYQSTSSEAGDRSSCKDSDTDDVIIKSGGNEWIYNLPEYVYISSKKSTKRLYEILDQLIVYQDYLSVRDMYCAIHFELNKRFSNESDGIQSPRFRPRKIIPFIVRTQADSFLSNDTQIIAMHWHHCRGHRDTNDKLAKQVYGGEVFDQQAASEFVVTKGKASLKAELIELNIDEKWASGSFDDKEIRKQWNDIKAYVKKSKNLFKHLSLRNPQIKKSVDVWSDLLMAMLIEQSCTESIDDLSPLQISKRYQLISGKPMKRQAARSKIKSIKKYLPDWHEMQ